MRTVAIAFLGVVAFAGAWLVLWKPAPVAAAIVAILVVAAALKLDSP